MTNRDRDEFTAKYLQRRNNLLTLARSLETEVTSYLKDIQHIDRIYFRAKDAKSFVQKALTLGANDSWKYEHPFEEIEDQVAGRVLVFYRSDIDNVAAALLGKLKKAESEYKRPSSAKEFDYETRHIVCALTPDLQPPGWSDLDDPPQTFELQIRTLAQHAWAEPQHGFYKGDSGLEGESLRKLYWASASAWGLDSIWEEIRRDAEPPRH